MLHENISDVTFFVFSVFFFKQKTAYEIMPSLVGSEMCIRDRYKHTKRDVVLCAFVFVPNFLEYVSAKN